MQSNAASSRGFTLLELMVGITVLGILLGLGVPAFNEIIRNNRVAAQTNELITALSLARSEASKRGMPVSICASNSTQNGCADDDEDNWGNGWFVFSDRTGVAGEIDDDDEVLQRWRAASGGLQLATNDIGFVRFGPDGALLSNAVVFNLQHEQCSGENLRQISIVATGRANLAKVSCP